MREGTERPQRRRNGSYERLVTVLLLVMISNTSCASPEPVGYDDFGIRDSETGEILGHVDGSVTTFREALGSPAQVETRAFDFGDYVELSYDGIQISYFSNEPNEVDTVALTSPRYTVLRGLGPESELREFIDLLGDPELEGQLEGHHPMAVFVVPNPQGSPSDENTRFEIQVGYDDRRIVQYVYLTTSR